MTLRRLRESRFPVKLKQVPEVISGCINLNGLLKIKVIKEFGESTVSKILDLVENSGSKRKQKQKTLLQNLQNIIHLAL